MPIAVELRLPDTTALYQESPYLQVTLKNIGAAPVHVARPDSPVSKIRLRAVNVKTGKETLTQLERTRPRFTPPTVPIAPGKTLEVRPRLLAMLPPLAPGTYALSALAEEHGGGSAESPAVMMKIVATTPANLSLIDVRGRPSPILYGAWVNLASDPPRVVRSRFNLVEEGTVDNAIAVADSQPTVRTQPAISACNNDAPANVHWVAWVDGGSLYFSHVDDRVGPTAPRKVAPSAPRAEIVAPLYTEPLTDPKVRPGGAVLLLVGDEGGGRGRLEVVELDSKRGRIVANLDLPGSRPAWAGSQFRTNGTRMAFYAQPAGEAAALSMVPWPSAGRRTAPRELGKWNGRVIAGGTAIDRKDVISGGLLLAVTEGTQRETVMVPWKVDAQGTFKQQAPQKLKWDPTKEMASAAVRVDEKGTPLALMREGGGPWVVLMGEKRIELPEKVRESPLAVDVGFFGGGTRPILICGKEANGFELMELDGSPLPPRFQG